MELFWSELESSPADGHVSEPDRRCARALLEGAERRFPGLAAPSPLGTVLFSACAGRIGIFQGDGVWGVAACVSLLGYACRMAERPMHPRNSVTAAIESHLVFTPGGEIDYDAFFEDRVHMASFCDRVAELAEDPSGISAIGEFSADAWDTFSTGAISRLHKNFIRHGVPRQALPQAATGERLLRLGYVLRLVDEAAGERPAQKPRGPTVAAAGMEGGAESRLPEGAALDVAAWLRETVLCCVEDFPLAIERLLEAGTLAVLGLTSFDQLSGDTDVLSVADARIGYALREQECRHVAGARRQRPGDPLSGAIEERAPSGEPRADELVRLLSEVIRYGYFGGAETMLDALPGAASRSRSAALAAAIDRVSPDEQDNRDGALALLHYGYLLHRVLELRPDQLDLVPGGRDFVLGDSGGGLGGG